MLNDPEALSTVGAWSMNVFSSVGVIMVNKAIMSNFGFGFATTLTAFHFVATASFGNIVRAAGFLTNKQVPRVTLLWFSFIASTAVVTMNLSLMLNSVGFYQIAKLSIIPSCCFFEAVLNRKTYSTPVKISVVVVMLGVAICTVTDVSMNAKGFIAAVAAVLSTTFQQIYIGSLQKKHNIGSFDLLSKTAPYQAVILSLSGPFVDFLITKNNVLAYKLTSTSAAFMMLSCVLALFVNLSMYLCIGKFSAVSFQVLGHMKTLLVLTLGWFLFGSALTLKNIMGMLVAVLGMILYSWAVEKEKLAMQAILIKPESDRHPTDLKREK